MFEVVTKHSSKFFLLLFALISCLSVASYADSNGVWHHAEDIVSGIFGSDEGSGIFQFVGALIIKDTGTTLLPQLAVIEESEQSAIIVVDSGVATVQQSSIDFSDKGTSIWSVGKDTANDFYIQELNGPAQVVIKRGGLVGINTANPTEELTVVGDVDATRYCLDGTCIDDWSKVPVSGAPVGAIMPFAMATPPTDWLECNGAPVSRTEYAELFATIGTSWGQGDGSTTFNVPDFRGHFLRGWDHGAGYDPDSGSRTNKIVGGATGDTVGSYQQDEFKAHPHFSGGPQMRGLMYRNDYMMTSIQQIGGSETRPKNAYVMYAIRAK